ncbi:MAG: SMP-30/gluconolactonase/LRE family protein [Actinomycetota bacterium]|nr:SMP-30/gluconolactonase/LRE family protein [Actinomycetota bacterium]
MIERITTDPDLLGECPVWDADSEVLWWVDIEGRAIRRYAPGSGTLESRGLDYRPGSLALTSQPDRLLVAMEHQVGWFDWAAGTWEPWQDLESAGTGNRLNDGRCDPAGRFWVGSMFERAAEGRFTGLLHRFEASGASSTVRSEIGVSNGLAFSPDGRTMYHADTLRDTVWVYDYDLASGERSNERVFTQYRDLPGRPDGACIDSDGCYWTACVGGSAIARLTPEGEVDRVIELPVVAPTMPAFGGAGLSTLFVTSLRQGGGGLASGEHDGHLLALDVGVSGIPEPGFAG